MRRVYVIFLALALMLTISCQQKAGTEAEKAKVNKVLENYITSIENEDMDLYAKVMAHVPDMVNFGTSENPIVGWDALKKVIEDQNAALSETKITVSDLAIHVSESGNLAWATCLWNFKSKIGENPIELPVRCTWILEKQGPDWVIVHFHKSVAASA
jgi:ketosteroid isomerase-like protein